MWDREQMKAGAKRYKRYQKGVTPAYTVRHLRLPRGWFLSKTVYHDHDQDYWDSARHFPANKES